MARLEGLKRVARGLEHKVLIRDGIRVVPVKDAESAADHGWSLAMFSVMFASELGLDAFKMVWMALVHKVSEIITLDIRHRDRDRFGCTGASRSE